MKYMALVAALAATQAGAQDYPVTITHKFGSTTITAPPERVATVDYNGADNLLALGVQPVLVRYWWGDNPRAVWPWADVLMDDNPEIIRDTLDFEQIAATRPDVITAIYSGITEAEYEKLSLIAPVVAVPEGVGDYALGWESQARLIGLATGHVDEAEAQITALEQRLEDMRGAYPNWQGRTVTLGAVFKDSSWLYTPNDPRVQLLNQMGFENNADVAALRDTGKFTVPLSEEVIAPFQSDLLVWMTTVGPEGVYDLSFRPVLPAVQEEREVILGFRTAAALSHASLLSLPYALDQIEPVIARAMAEGVPPQEAVTE